MDVDEMVVLGRKRAMRACGIHGVPKLQQVHLHDEDSQHDKNTRENVPEGHGVPLEGGLAVYASDSAKSSGNQEQWDRESTSLKRS